MKHIPSSKSCNLLVPTRIQKTDKITEENLSQKSSLVSIAKNKDPRIGVKMHQTFFFTFTTLCLISAEWM